MPQILSMPSEQELPDGPQRRFVAELHHCYEKAMWPPLRELAASIQADHSKAGTASKETIRRMLRGETVPRHWLTVQAVLEALCERAGENPRAQPVPPLSEPLVALEERGPSPQKVLEDLWRQAIRVHQSSVDSPATGSDSGSE